MRTTPCHSAHHVVLFCLYLPCRPNASVSVYCRDKDFATCGAVFVPRWENWNRWLCLIWAYKSVVLSFFFYATIFKLIHHIGLPVLLYCVYSALPPAPNSGKLTRRFTLLIPLWNKLYKNIRNLLNFLLSYLNTLMFLRLLC